MSTTSILAVVSALNDLAMIQAAAMPLVQRAMAAGQTEISNEELAAASAALGSNIDALDAAILRAQVRESGQGSLLG
jgi:hypothetical protein